MGLFRKKKQETKAAHPLFAKLLNLAILVFVVVMIADNMRATTKQEAPSATANCADADSAAEQTAQAKLRSYYISAAEIHALELLKMTGKQELVSHREPGDGAFITCGQTLKYQMELQTYPDRKPDQAFKGFVGKVEKWRIGDISDDRSQLLQIMATGLNVGGTGDYAFPRSALLKILAPGTPVNDSDNSVAIARMKVLSASPEAPKSSIPSTVIEVVRGSSDKQARCGNIVHVHLRSWKLDGTPVGLSLTGGDTAAVPAKGNMLEFNTVLGSGQLPYGIERVVEGLGMNGTRMVVVPPEFIAPFPAASKTLPHVAFADHSQALLVEVRTSPVEQKASPEKTQGTPAKASVDKSDAQAKITPEVATIPAPSSDDSTPTIQ